MYRHVVYLDVVEWLILFVDWFPLHQVDTLKSIDHSSEYRVHFVELRLF